MSMTRWHTSPLLATIVVLAGLCLLAVPLHRLTSATPAPAPAVAAVVERAELPAVLRVKLLAPAREFRVETPDGRVLVEAAPLPAGESERDVVVALDHGVLDLTLRATFADDAAETAVFVTLLPDGHDEQTRFATGAGLIGETLHFEWPHSH